MLLDHVEHPFLFSLLGRVSIRGHEVQLASEDRAVFVFFCCVIHNVKSVLVMPSMWVEHEFSAHTYQVLQGLHVRMLRFA